MEITTEHSIGDGTHSIEMQGPATAVLATVMLLMESSSSESEDEENEIIIHMLRRESNIFHKGMAIFQEKNRRNSIKSYIEETVPKYNNVEFRSHFRVSREIYESLTNLFSKWPHYEMLRSDKRIPANVQVLCFLWFAGHESCSFRDLSDRFNMSLSTISAIINRVSLFFSSLSPEIIRWPSDEKKEESSKYFAEKCMIPKAIGCIDGTHVVIDPPKSGKDEYIDRKGNVTVCLQGICDERNNFINVFVGYPGSCHDSWVLKNSPIYNKLPSYCGGDSAYPCNKYIITPYKDNGHLRKAQKEFNMKLSTGRIKIEHSFGILKQRFRQLYYCKLRGMRKLCHFIRACCVLHNIANEDGMHFEPTAFQEEEEDFMDDYPDNDNISRGDDVRNAISKSIQDVLTTKN